jgi:two-component system, chemotaxis family, CheB/CheR fusion protein
MPKKKLKTSVARKPRSAKPSAAVKARIKKAKPKISKVREAIVAPVPPPEPVVDDLVVDIDDEAGLPEFTIVGIGASAGGLEACTDLLKNLKTDTGMAFVIVQHLAPSRESAMAELLQAVTRMPVWQVTNEQRVEPNHVYIIPPGQEMGIADGKLNLMPRPDNSTLFLPIDYFFRSLAAYAQSRAIGVILSGTASDGATGLREIKGAGGIAMAQEPGSARHDGMPRAAINLGVVDVVLPPAEIAAELERIAALTLTGPTWAKMDEDEPVRDEMANIFHMLKTSSGVDFTYYKKPTIRRRLQRRMVLHKLRNLKEYQNFLKAHPDEVAELYKDLLIHVTRFFREPDSFNSLREIVFPAIFGMRRGEIPARIWIPGCSTGEEPYSIAIAIMEYLGQNINSTPVQIFGTDVSDMAVEQARAGLYPESIVADVSPERLRRFFQKVDGHYRISKLIRDMCIFARQDLTRDPPFSRMDLIVCRNVLIYLDLPLQKKLMNVFHYALKPTGYLMLGSAETVGPHSDLFTVADKKFKLYTKKLAARRTDIDFIPSEPAPPRPPSSRHMLPEPHPATNVAVEANRVLLSRYTPAGVIVNHDMQIVQFRGQTGLFLEPAPGEASLNLFKMAREGLLHGLRAAVNEARRSNGIARKDGLRVRYNGHVNDVDVEVIPLNAAGEAQHLLVLFHRPRAAVASGAAVKKKRPKGAERVESQIKRLQEELAASREYLQSIIQDLEASNEELQSANEEILSSNEELQSTNEELDTAKEELQSTNEELNTVNEELTGRNEELSRANSDMVNLLASVQIAIVLIASDLRIRRFTQTAEKLLNLIPSDVGRPISDIKPNIDCPDLETLIVEAIDSVAITERMVKDRSGKSMLLRIRPYKNTENRIDGAVMALLEVGEPKREENA